MFLCIFPQANACRFPILSTRTYKSVCVSPGFHIGLCPHFTLGYAGVPPLQGSLSYRLLYPQGFISGFALISPWALQGCRPCRAHCRIGRVSPGFHIGLCPHSTLGFAGVPPFQGSLHAFAVFPGFHIGLRPHFTLGYAGVPPFQGSLSDWLCVPRVPYRALPSFHPGPCGGVALSGLFVGLAAFPQGFISGFASFHPGLCRSAALSGLFARFCCFPRVSYRASPSFYPGLCRSIALSGLFVVLAAFPQGFISGFALISPWAMQECRPCRALCRIGCVYPGFHIGLCSHFPLGFAGVPPFQGSLSDCLLLPQGFISGFALIPPWAMQECRPFRAK